MTVDGELFGQRPSPRVLVVGADDSEESLSDSLSFAATLEFASPIDVGSYRLSEWDVAVFPNGLVPLSVGAVVNQVIFGGDNIGSVRNSGGPGFYLQATRISVAREICVSTGISEQISSLVKKDILDTLLQGNNRAWRHQSTQVRQQPTRHSEYLTAFAYDGDDQVLAGEIRPFDNSKIWYLPGIADVGAWVRLALQEWAVDDPARFGIRGEWKESTRWMTPDELKLTLEQSADDAVLAEHVRQHEERSAARQAEILAARTSANASERRLLMSQGDALVKAVREALEEIGFEVADMDAAAAETKGVKLEDLRVRDSDGFVAVVEIRGYTGGAKTGDLLRLGQFTTRFAAETGSEPRAVWYIVNQFIERDPETRAEPLASRPEDVEAFAETGGAVFDTRRLFDLVIDVRAGLLASDEAKQLLRKARGVFSYAPSRAFD